MRNYWKWTLSLALSAMMVATVKAGELFPEVETVELLILRQHSVQQELKVGKTESQAIKSFTDAQHKKAMEASKLSAAEQQKKFDELAKENEDFLKKNLSKAQQDRLRQISMQRASLMWVTHPDIAKKLNLDAKQLEKAKADQMLAREETDAALAATDKKERQKKLHELKQTCHKRMTVLLTSEQQTKWKELVGGEFEGEFNFE